MDNNLDSVAWKLIATDAAAVRKAHNNFPAFEPQLPE
jgi:hypothetical protein